MPVEETGATGMTSVYKSFKGEKCPCANSREGPAASGSPTPPQRGKIFSGGRSDRSPVTLLAQRERFPCSSPSEPRWGWL